MVVPGDAGRGMRQGCWLLAVVMLLGLIAADRACAANCKEIKQALQKERNLKKKRAMLADAILQCPEDPVLNYKYGLSLERFRKYDKALDYYQKAASLNPKMGKAYVGMGDVYIYLGRLNDSIEAYHQAVKLMPGNDRAAGRLARLEVKRKALTGGVLTTQDFVTVMDHRGKISTTNLLLLTGPVLQYQIAFAENSDTLLPTGIRQLGVVGQAMQDDALKYVRFEIDAHVNSLTDSRAALEASKKQAEMIKLQLETNFQIDPQRIVIKWYGNSQPLEVPDLVPGGFVSQRVEFRRLVD